MYYRNKTKLIAWYVSNCQTDSYRERYVQELKKYIQIDVYGRCGNLDCPKTNKEECDEFLRKTYKFYLSLENAACKDYVTEKFFYRLYEYVVPIVLRRSDYQRIAPPRSFLALDDFRSPRHLAEYLLYLNENDEKYFEYYEWRNRYDVATDHMTKFCYCDLCNLLQIEDRKNAARKTQFINTPKKLNIHKWWYVDGACDHRYAYKLLKSNTTDS